MSESLPLKQSIFKSLSQEIQPDAILATNTSSISITKIAAAVVPEGQSAASEEGKKAAGRVVGMSLRLPTPLPPNDTVLLDQGLHWFNPVPVMVRSQA